MPILWENDTMNCAQCEPQYRLVLMKSLVRALHKGRWIVPMPERVRVVARHMNLTDAMAIIRIGDRLHPSLCPADSEWNPKHGEPGYWLGAEREA